MHEGRHRRRCRRGNGGRRGARAPVPGVVPDNPSRASCKPYSSLSGVKAAVLFCGFYLVALGVGGIKGSLLAHDAEQFDEETPQGRRGQSTFNYFVFCLSCGALVAVTFVVWVEDNKGWQWGFAVSTVAILLSVPVFLAGSATYRNEVPTGSPLTTIAKVVAGAILNTGAAYQSPSSAVMDMAPTPIKTFQAGEQGGGNSDLKEATVPNPSAGLRFLNRAVERKPAHRALAWTVQEVEEVKVFVGILPIFFSTIMLSCCLAQLSTSSIRQAATMDTRIGSLTVPLASLPVFPIVFIMILAPIYDHVNQHYV